MYPGGLRIAAEEEQAVLEVLRSRQLFRYYGPTPGPSKVEALEDEVIIPAYTWIASASAVAAVGAVPILAEVDESLTLDPKDVERRISPYTRAILPVHMRGAPCRMPEVLALARRHGLKVLEDTAQANGASYGGARLGSLGDAGAYSLQFNKVITSLRRRYVPARARPAEPGSAY